MLKLININANNILRDLNLEVNKGEFIIVVGENGTGKSTLFNIISGAIKPSSGKIYINNKDITKFSQYKRAKIITNVVQDPKSGTISEMTIFENLYLSYMRGKRKNIKPLSKNLMKNLFYTKLKTLNMELENRMNDYVGQLSGGQRQALSLIMATISNYDILLLDEITAALDPKSSANIMRIVTNLTKKENKTCLAITHDLKYMNTLGARVLKLSNGKLY